jgi:hypothetical protein
VGRVGGDARRARQRRAGRRERGERAAAALGDRDRGLLAGAGERDRELLAADAGDEAGLAPPCARAWWRWPAGRGRPRHDRTCR